MNLYPLLLLFFGGIIFTLGDVAMKFWVGNRKFSLYALGLLLYLISDNFLAQSFKFKNIAVASMIIITFNVIFITLISWFYFKEKLNLMEIAGLILAIIAIVVIELGKLWSSPIR